MFFGHSECWASTALAILLVILSSASKASQPTHRYSFNGNAEDSIGAAHGALIGNATITNGALVLNGTNGCVQLPANLFTNSSSLTLETWFQENTNIQVRMLWFLSGSPDVQYTLRLAAAQSFGYGAYGSLTTTSQVISAAFSLGKTHHLVWSQDYSSHTTRVYLDGQPYGANTNFTASPGATTTNSYLGGQSISAPIRGKILEFRTYSNALSHLEILQSTALGPESLPTDGDMATNLSLRVSSHVGANSLTQPIVLADFQYQPPVDISLLADIVFTSSDTNVIMPAAFGKLRAVGVGQAEVVATWGGLSATNTITVTAADQYDLVHRYDFAGLPGSTNLLDLVGNADGTLLSGAQFTNGTQVVLPGYVDLPDGILSSLDAVTIEAWVTGFALNGTFWPRVFDFGDSSSNSYFFLTPCALYDNPLGTNTEFIRFAVATNGIPSESPRLTAKPWMVDGFETHFAVTYDPASNRSQLFVNGVLGDVGTALYPLSSIVDVNNWLGRSQFPADAFFRGFFNEFRIHRVALEASQIAASYALGPDVVGSDFALRSHVAGTNLVLSWGPSASWCTLQTATALHPGPVWTNVGMPPVFTNGQFQTTVSLSDTERYFRLLLP